MPKSNRSLIVALVLQVAALLILIVLYVYLRGVATEEQQAPMIRLPAGGAEQPGRPADPAPQPRSDAEHGTRLGRR